LIPADHAAWPMSPGLEYNCGSLLNLHIRAPSGEPARECPRLARMGTVNRGDVDERIALHVEVCQSPASSAAPADVEQAVRRFIGTQSLRYEDGPLALERGRDSFLDAHVLSVCVCDTAAERAAPLGQKLLFWQAPVPLRRNTFAGMLVYTLKLRIRTAACAVLQTAETYAACAGRAAHLHLPAE